MAPFGMDDDSFGPFPFLPATSQSPGNFSQLAGMMPDAVPGAGLPPGGLPRPPKMPEPGGGIGPAMPKPDVVQPGESAGGLPTPQAPMPKPPTQAPQAPKTGAEDPLIQANKQAAKAAEAAQGQQGSGAQKGLGMAKMAAGVLSMVQPEIGIPLSIGLGAAQGAMGGGGALGGLTGALSGVPMVGGMASNMLKQVPGMDPQKQKQQQAGGAGLGGLAQGAGGLAQGLIGPPAAGGVTSGLDFLGGLGSFLPIM